MKVSIDIDLEDYPELVEAARDKLAEKYFAAVDEAEEAADAKLEVLNDVSVDLQDARRMLTRPTPSPTEAMIYIERALVAIANVDR